MARFDPNIPARLVSTATSGLNDCVAPTESTYGHPPILGICFSLTWNKSTDL